MLGPLGGPPQAVPVNPNASPMAQMIAALAMKPGGVWPVPAMAGRPGMIAASKPAMIPPLVMGAHMVPPPLLNRGK